MAFCCGGLCGCTCVGCCCQICRTTVRRHEETPSRCSGFCSSIVCCDVHMEAVRSRLLQMLTFILCFTLLAVSFAPTFGRKLRMNPSCRSAMSYEPIYLPFISLNNPAGDGTSIQPLQTFDSAESLRDMLATECAKGDPILIRQIC